jgi:hypothetical protein
MKPSIRSLELLFYLERTLELELVKRVSAIFGVVTALFAITFFRSY